MYIMSILFCISFFLFFFNTSQQLIIPMMFPGLSQCISSRKFLGESFSPSGKPACGGQQKACNIMGRDNDKQPKNLFIHKKIKLYKIGYPASSLAIKLIQAGQDKKKAILNNYEGLNSKYSNLLFQLQYNYFSFIFYYYFFFFLQSFNFTHLMIYQLK